MKLLPNCNCEVSATLIMSMTRHWQLGDITLDTYRNGSNYSAVRNPKQTFTDRFKEVK